MVDLNNMITDSIINWEEIKSLVNSYAYANSDPEELIKFLLNKKILTCNCKEKFGLVGSGVLLNPILNVTLYFENQRDAEGYKSVYFENAFYPVHIIKFL